MSKIMMIGDIHSPDYISMITKLANKIPSDLPVIVLEGDCYDNKSIANKKNPFLYWELDLAMKMWSTKINSSFLNKLHKNVLLTKSTDLLMGTAPKALIKSNMDKLFEDLTNLNK